MIVFTVKVHLKGIKAQRISRFFLNCDDKQYAEWWPGTHLQFHSIKKSADVIGTLVYFDEYIGRRRFRMKGRITEYQEHKKILYRLVALVNLPAWLNLEFEDTETGVMVTHTLKCGYTGFGSFLDFFLKMYFTQRFEDDLETHARTEFKKLETLLV